MNENSIQIKQKICWNLRFFPLVDNDQSSIGIVIRDHDITMLKCFIVVMMIHTEIVN